MIRSYRGRLYFVYEDSKVGYTDEWAFDHWRPADNYLQFPRALKIMEPVDDGIYFADAKRTDFYSFVDPNDVQNIVEIFPDIGAIFGTGHRHPDNERVVWTSDDSGMIVAGPGGQVQKINDENVATGSADSGTAICREIDGILDYIALLKNPQVSGAAASSWVQTEVIRKGA